MQYFTHVYTGNGKGKTTAAIGLALRAAGSGRRVYIGQFSKGMRYSELAALEHVPGVDVELFGWDDCVVGRKITDDMRSDTLRGLERCREKAASEDYSMLILDEVLIAIKLGLLEENTVLSFMDDFHGKLELVLTGRYGSEAVMDAADLVTEMRCIKHYHEQGVLSRKGVDC